MPTDNIETKLEKEKQVEPETAKAENIDVELNRIEAEAEATTIENRTDDTPHPQFVTPQPAQPKVGIKERIKRVLRSKKFWASFILLVIAGAAAAWFIEPSRWWALGLVGQKTQLTIQLSAPSEGKQQAAKLKNVIVTVNGRDFTSNQNGEVEIPDQPYGKVSIKATKQGYSTANYEGVIDFDPFFYQFGGREEDEAAKKVQLELKAVGVAVSFKAVDFLSGQPITDGQYTVGDLIIKPDEQGIVAFKAPVEDSDTVKVTSDFAGKYIDKSFDLQLNAKEPPSLTFVPGGKHYFMSKRDGALSIYSSNVDGTEVQQLIPGTGQETPNTAFSVSPSGKYGVLASTRDAARDTKGVLQQRLYVIDLEKKQMTKVDDAEEFAFADWAGDKLVYTRVAKAADGKYQRSLKTIEVSSKKTSDIATATNIYNVAVSFEQIVYVQTEQLKDTDTIQQKLVRYDIKNNNAKDLGSGTSSYVQQDFDRIAFQTFPDQKWHDYNFNTGQLKDAASPAQPDYSQVFLSTASPDGTRRIKIDRIDGKFTIIAKTTADGAEKQLYGTGGLGGPIRWIQNDVIVFRVVNDRETADYVLSIKGGQPKKITDVTATVSTAGSAADPNLYRYY